MAYVSMRQSWIVGTHGWFEECLHVHCKVPAVLTRGHVVRISILCQATGGVYRVDQGQGHVCEGLTAGFIDLARYKNRLVL